MKKFTLLLTMIVGMMLIGGCATKWVKPGGTEREFEATKAHCQSKSLSQYPPRLREVTIGTGYTTPVTTNCYSIGYSVNCYTTGGDYVPPIKMTVDDNDSSRKEATKGCLYQHGWTPEK